MPKLIQQLATASAEKNPNATAVVAGGESLTYGELERLSNRLARALEDRGVERGDRVALFAPYSPVAALGILGIYKADAIYIPLDPWSPAARQKKILASIESPWILAAGPVGGSLDDLLKDEPQRSSISVGWIGNAAPGGTSFEPGFYLADLDAYDETPRDYRNREDDPAHIFFTSGSTGAPKGVVGSHRGVVSFVRWFVDYFGLQSGDRPAGHMPLHFDVSIADMFSCFAAGAELRIVPREVNVLPNRLADFMREAGLTHWFTVPSFLNYMAKFDAVRPGDLPSLRQLLWCGEVLPAPVLIYWMKRLPHVRFTNLYGPTETTVVSAYYTVPACPDDACAPIPAGVPCPGEEVLVLDDKLDPVPPGTIGDIYIGGAGVTLGYWKDAEKTRSAFLPDPRGADPAARIYKTGDLGKIGEDGMLYFVGRADHQIKCRGYRVELGDIEAALNGLEGLRECAVVWIPVGGFEGAKICCAYVPLEGAEIAPAALRSALAELLPGYMVPTAWMPFAELPRNANGKIDRPRLAAEFKRSEAAGEPAVHRAGAA